MIRLKRLDHIQLCIPRGMEAEARAFYGKVIGLQEIPKPKELIANGGLWFQAADIQLHIGVEDEPGKSKRHPAFEVEDLAEARRHLEQYHISIKEETQIPEQIRLSFFDPFGNRIELLQKNSQ